MQAANLEGCSRPERLVALAEQAEDTSHLKTIARPTPYASRMAHRAQGI
jgi:hypothetical protein